MTKKQLALEIIKRLKEAYPDAGCTLDYDRGMETFGECPSGCAVYGCESQCDRGKVI